MGIVADTEQKASGEVMRVHSAERDSVGKAVARTLNPKHLCSMIKRGVACLKQQGAEQLWREISFRADLALHRETWKYRADLPLKRELKQQRQQTFSKMPLVSILVPLYNTPLRFLKECIQSCLAQSYSHFELVLADASSEEKKSAIQKTVEAFGDDRIVYLQLEQNLGIAGNTNAALSAAKGDYITLLDHDDVLQPNALYEVVKVIHEQQADFIYSDEIVLSENLKELVQYHFKPDFSPDYLRGVNYITHLSAFSKELLEKAGGGLRSEYDGAQDYDLILRLTEKAEKVWHIRKVLYFWRGAAGSTAAGIQEAKPYAIEAGKKALEAHLQREMLQGTVTAQKDHPGSYRVQYQVTAAPLISVIIPNKDHIEDLRRCLASLYQKAGRENFEVLVVENNSTEPETFAAYQQLQQEYPALRVITYVGGFNFSAICNLGASKAKGSHLLLLNNDIEVVSENFLTELLSYSQRPDVGAVGAKLLYPDDTIQHGGVIVGINGSAGHSHKSHPAASGGDMYRLCTPQNYLAVTGACLMVKTKLYRACQGLEEADFGVAYNDVDFCLRLYEMGYRNVFTPFAVAYHYESKSRGYDTEGEKKDRHDKEKQAFAARYQKYFKAGDPFYNPHFTYLYENYGYR